MSATFPTSTTFDLLDRARATLLLACRAGSADDRYLHAHLGALRAAAALLSARDRRGGGVRRATWSALTDAAPELGEWSAYFAATTARREELQRGAGPVSHREADDLLRAAETFIGLVLSALGLPLEPLPAAHAALAAAGRP